MGRKPTLSRDDWIDAAADWIAEHGVGALAVEPLARALGVTKGAFYWHFASRDALLTAVLERWEAEGTEAVIRLVDAMPDSAQHAVQLIRLVTRTVTDEGPTPTRAVRLQYALWCAAADPLVAPAVERVTAARVRYLAQVLAQAGLAPPVAADRAKLGYASYVGMVVLQATRGQGGGAGLNAPALVDVYLTMLLTPPPA
ncbi:TetR/AcrR family transcriptional regulator [Aquincola sp. S2]|uniref:TetR/AcrR family transcriptional regulator n=1 Tax=Pseudaquabacterium terrae TaxID=2732868 RepID=A0ABX2EC35_9BURK|nr:TetR/AcrR family transcriptional regulator [Aquabacterium terrae]NRF66166.1 TetR/AcrR family transcriptional regulator [Aquabacterium terrae]